MRFRFPARTFIKHIAFDDRAVWNRALQILNVLSDASIFLYLYFLISIPNIYSGITSFMQFTAFKVRGYPMYGNS